MYHGCLLVLFNNRPRRDAGGTNTSSAAPPPLAGATAGCSDLVPLRGTPVCLTVPHPSCGDEARGIRVFSIFSRVSYQIVYLLLAWRSTITNAFPPGAAVLEHQPLLHYTGRLRWPTLVTAFIISLALFIAPLSRPAYSLAINKIFEKKAKVVMY